MLSSEIATLLSGRYIQIRVYPLSYIEFLHFHSLNDSDTSLKKYIRYGGMPYLHNLTLNDEVVFEYLKNIYTTILFKDVTIRHNIRNVNFLERLVYFLAENTGSIVSAKKINDFLKSQQIKISYNIVLNYLSYLSDAFFIRKVPRFDIKGKKIFEIGEKYYFEDLGLRHAITGYRPIDINKVLENIVHQHLSIAGYKIFIGQLKQQEIDFVGKKNNEKLYVQVAYLLSNGETIEKEFGNLALIQDNYPKMVVTLDKFSQGNTKGIPQIHLRKFLTETIKL